MRSMTAGTRRPHRLAAAVAALLALASAAAWAAPGVSEGKRPRPLTVAAGGASVVATQGSYCVVSHRSGMCADFAYPLRVKRRVPVAPHGLVVLRTHDRAIHRASVTFLRATRHDFNAVGASLTARRAPGHPAKLRFRLPDDLGNANRLDIAATYTHRRGDSDWWAGIKPRSSP